jgi:hypothetical protein
VIAQIADVMAATCRVFTSAAIAKVRVSAALAAGVARSVDEGKDEDEGVLGGSLPPVNRRMAKIMTVRPLNTIKTIEKAIKL